MRWGHPAHTGGCEHSIRKETQSAFGSIGMKPQNLSQNQGGIDDVLILNSETHQLSNCFR